MIQSIRGFKDILPGETELWQSVSKVAVGLFQDFGYDEISTPIMEKTDLFARSIGEGTDIVEKEMYTFPDRKGSLITLRPEATASIVRAYIQHKMYTTPDGITRLYTLGPMFRRERPQKGRYRQFCQIDVELFGIGGPYADAELIFMLHTLLSRFSIKGTIVHLNSLGCSCCRPFFKAHLIDLISDVASSLCTDCVRRKDRNPLRVLDCKNKSCRETISNTKGIIDFLCYDCKEHFNLLIDLLCQLNVPYKVDKHLVRGLDYYTRTAFEIHHSSLGAQSAIAGGGRYDGLVRTLGGPDIPAIGFAIGFNRLVEIIGLNSNLDSRSPELFFAILGERAMELAFQWQMKLNETGIRVMTGRFNQSLKVQMKQANRANALYVLIIGEEEIGKGEVVFRCMNTGFQFNIPIDNVLAQIKINLSKCN